MKKMDIIRIEHSDAYCIGVFMIDGELTGVTMELPWRNNKREESCIPDGTYRCKRRYSELVSRITRGSIKDTFEVMDVPGRSGILIHPGNTTEDTLGCILLGRNAGVLRSPVRAVLNSGLTFASFMDMARGTDEFDLDIRWYNRSTPEG